ncbi:uncharacterized protein LOC126782485 [Argentina anserina]|uniref:uncharacterized protein LOC126782485 n=1 Tax=Argentina anserina TaxID=57926 RepID=UPI0021762F75|nr:uncharacterized protein LOC126782485 [Potentilla anserina]
MEKDCLRHTNINDPKNIRERTGGDSSLLLRSSPDKTTTSEFVLQWGNRKRLRCMKIQVKDDSSGVPVTRTTVRVDRRVIRSDKDSSTTNGYLNLRQRPSSPQQPPLQRVLRNSETSSAAMRAHQSNGGAVRGIASPDRAGDKKGTANNHHNYHHNDNHHKSAASSDSKKGGSSSGSGDAAAPPVVWPPKFVIALTNKEKEEDFMAIKGSKLPQRPKKRAKFIQRTVNLVTPGAWLCDLTLERYEVREKKISKKRPRGLKAMGTMVESDSE